jgi:hypothetical protein
VASDQIFSFHDKKAWLWFTIPEIGAADGKLALAKSSAQPYSADEAGAEKKQWGVITAAVIRPIRVAGPKLRP